MRKQINYNACKYLNNYDIINKLNFKSIYEIPVYNKIELKNFVKDSSLSKITALQLQSNFYYYLLGITRVSLKFNYVALSAAARLRSVSIESKVQSKIVKNLILDFLFNYYLILNKLSRSFVLYEDSFEMSKLSGKPRFKNFNLISYIPANALIENREQSIIKFDDLKIFIFCQIKQPILYFYKKQKNKNFNFNLLYFKNIFPFWVFN
jgi:hypothetical protein